MWVYLNALILNMNKMKKTLLYLLITCFSRCGIAVGQEHLENMPSNISTYDDSKDSFFNKQFYDIIEYLDENKQKLNRNIIVWMCK